MLINIFVLAIAHLITRKQLDVEYYVNRAERTSRRLKVTAGIFVFIGGIVGVIAAAAAEVGPAAIVGAAVAAVAGIVTAAIFGSVLKPVKHTDGIFRVRGCSDDFLRQVQGSIDEQF